MKPRTSFAKQLLLRVAFWAAAVALTSVVGTSGCGALPAPVAGVLGKAEVCVLSQIAERGVDDPLALLGACAGSTLASIAEVTGAWLASVTGANAAPKASEIQARMARAHDRAVSALGDGGSAR